MKLGEIYEFVIKEAMKKDPRGYEAVNKALREEKKKYHKLKADEKSYFDKERLRNPYSDTRILYGDPSIEVEKVLVGIDIEAPEVILADRLNQRGEAIDLMISHHPEGSALAGLDEVMHLQEDVLVKAGLSTEVAKDFMDKRIKEVERNLHAGNHSRAVDSARLLNIPFMCMHTVADNFVMDFLQKLFDEKKPKQVKDVMNLLNKLPEYREARLMKAGPKLIAGKEDSKPGKILVDMTGGTEGSENIFGRLSQAGIGTLVCMHFSEKHFLKAKDEHLNIVIAGHISSDNLGLNLLMDKLENKAKIKILPCSGFIRIRRKEVN